VSADGGARGLGWQEQQQQREWQIDQFGQAAIVHHFACSRNGRLRYALVDDGIAYHCGECDARVTVGPDGKALSGSEWVSERRAGRPGWTDEIFRERWQEAIATTPPPRTFRRIATRFRPLDVSEQGIDPNHLRKLHKRHGEPAFDPSGE
jgi:hypothetical protein